MADIFDRLDQNPKKKDKDKAALKAGARVWRPSFGDIFDRVESTAQEASDKAGHGTPITRDNLIGMIPMAAGIAAVPFTEGLSMLPAMGATGLIGAAGKGLELGVRKLTGEWGESNGEFGGKAPSAKEAAEDIGLEGLLYAGTELGGRMVGAGIEAIGKKLAPRRLYQGIIKPSTTLKPAVRDQLLETGLRHEVMPNESGYNDLVQDITRLTKQIDAKIASKSGSIGDVIDPRSISRRLDALVKFYKQQAAPEEDIQAIEAVREQFLRKHSYDAPFTNVRPMDPDAGSGYVPTGKGKTRVYEPMNLESAQAEKRTTQIMNRKKYGEMGSARDEAEKQLAYALRRKITQLYPEIAALNKEDQGMFMLERELRRYVGREGNKNVIGLIPASTGKGLWATAIAAIDNPEIKARLAFAIRRAHNTPILGRTLGAMTPKRLLVGGGRALGAFLEEQPNDFAAEDNAQ